MEKSEQERIALEVLDGLRERIIEQLPKLPENWNGIEIRQWIIGTLTDGWQPSWGTSTESRKRKKSFFNDLLVKNL